MPSVSLSEFDHFEGSGTVGGNDQNLEGQMTSRENHNVSHSNSDEVSQDQMNTFEVSKEEAY